MLQNNKNFSVYLADDDADDRLLFEEALMEVNHDATLTTANNGEQLMQCLGTASPPPPHVIFLDLNMPLKNGYECLQEIKADVKYKDIPVVIFSTSCQKDSMDKVYATGADFYICKPDNFQKLKQLISRIFTINLDKLQPRRSREEFYIIV